MSRGGRNAAAVNARAMAEFRRQLEAVAGQFDESAGRIVVQLANTGMNETIRNTPVGEYSREVSFTTRSGRLVRFTTGDQKLGGTLKRGWRRLGLSKGFGKVSAGYSNDVEYAVYVNDGHRIVSGGVTKGFVPGRHMLEIGMRAAEKSLPARRAVELARVKRKTGF